MPVEPETIDRALSNAQAELLAARASHGGWEGELASSALATATAVFALGVVEQNGSGCGEESVERGLEWLVAAQNADGGWGDTPASLSNISTTSLAWAALVFLDRDHGASRAAAECWLERAAGSLEPADLAEAVASRYGQDRTFSVPILSMLAMAGCLGEERRAWRLVPPLPFELAACPHRWFKWLRLPVVSYALPALISLGYLRHKRLPSRNAAALAMRMLFGRRALRKLTEIQPASGGFLEATPLTSFVVMSLAGSGAVSHPVVDRGVEFLKRSQRADGSWPIDSNLATWVTTLAANALGASSVEALGEPERGRLLAWLLNQQYQCEHPYTHAAPGGWAWTDLPGGVPDADDTSGALLAMKVLAGSHQDALAAAENGITWLLDLQNRDGGVPTFCRGWGRLPFDRSSPDITAHAVQALGVWTPQLAAYQQRRCDRTLVRMLRYLVHAQRADGAWSPLWFGNQYAPAEENLTYGTSRVIRAAAVVPVKLADPRWQAAVGRGCRWLLAAQNEDGGWGGAPNGPSSIEETALSLEALAALAMSGVPSHVKSPTWTTPPMVSEIGEVAWQRALHRGAAWLCTATNGGRCFPPAAIGLYFAKLWYHEKLYPLIFSVAALRRLQAALRPDGEHGSFCAASSVESIAKTCDAID